MTDYSKYTTDEFKCRKCKRKSMYPNECDSKIMGFVCSGCGSVNYPIKDTLDSLAKKIKVQQPAIIRG